MTPLQAPHQGMRIPTIMGLILVIALVGVVIALFEKFSRGPTGAAGSTVPQDIAITNIADKSFTVVWTTPNPATGAVTILSPKHTPSTAFDDRDMTGTLKSYLTHSVTIRSLTPGTSYTFRVLSNGKNYSDQNKPYMTTTAPTLSGEGSGLEPAYGSINDSAGSPVAGALVLVTLEQGQILSTLSSPSGTWLLSLGFARNTSLSRYQRSEERITETIRVLYNNQQSNAITDTLNDAPVPTMLLGKTYDFRKQQASAQKNTTVAQTKRESPSVLGDTTIAKSSSVKVVSLTSPAQNASLTSSLPLISGTGIPGKKVSVVVGITNPTSGTTTVGNDGIWRYTPPQSLGAGKQSVTATSVDNRGKPVAITNTFTILKSGTQVLGDATPSASLTPTFTPTPVASAEASPSATPTPQLEGEPVPTSGTTLPTILLLLIGLTMMTGGVVLFSR
ncbi:MAG: Ig-like domain-containing protein [Candidatus Gottesmanbacteria bacterium]|nr:Ig-like domain-containing protein [Candidatus Gottesmanbacteria bacterium]